MIFKLKKELVPIIKQVDFSDMAIKPVILETETTSTVEVDDTCVDNFFLALNYEISLDGMDNNQNSINDYGKMLYRLYDEMLYQKHNK